MSKVIEFPKKDLSAQVVLSLLEQQMGSMDEVYDELSAAHTIINDLEKKASNMEDNFDSILRQYAEIIGVENLPTKMLHYSTNTKISIDPVTSEFRIEYGDGEEECD